MTSFAYLILDFLIRDLVCLSTFKKNVAFLGMFVLYRLCCMTCFAYPHPDYLLNGLEAVASKCISLLHDSFVVYMQYVSSFEMHGYLDIILHGIVHIRNQNVKKI